MSGGWGYLLANRYRGTISTGVTADLPARMMQHREGAGSRFAARSGVDRLVYAERLESIEDAILREKRIKKWSRDWKIELIEQGNPDWLDLFETLNA